MKKGLLLILAIMICAFLVGCGGTAEVVDNNDANNEQETTINETEKINETPLTYEEELENTKEALDGMELYSDDTKYVFKTDEDTTGIFYHNGNEITGYEVRVDCHTHELAEEAKTEYLAESAEEDEDIKDIRIDGSYLIVEYGPEEYKDLTLDAIKMTYSMFQVLRGEE